MLFVDTVKVVALLICCVISSKTDFQYGKIPNNMLAVFGVCGAIFDIFLMMFSSIDENKLFFTNAGSLIVIALVLYFLKVWAGGDCKLLIVIALLYPPDLYWKVETSTVTLWYALGFMFGTGFLYLTVESIVLFVREKRKKCTIENIKQIALGMVQYVKALIFMSALTHIYLFFIFPKFNIPGIFYTTLCVIYIQILSAHRFFQSKLAIGVFLLFDLTMTFFTGNITVSTMWTTYLLTIVFMIVRLFINRYNYKTIDAINVKQGMILSEMSSFLMQNSRIRGLPKISDESLNSRLSEEEAASIVRWSKSKNGCEQIIIVRKMPFAVFITGGILLYLAFRGAF